MSTPCFDQAAAGAPSAGATRAHLCKAPGCPQKAKPDQLMCRTHWFSLPKPLRDAIWDTWRSRDMRAYARNVQEAQRLTAAAVGTRVQSFPALTLWQPWASLIAVGAKPLEFRGWCAPKALVGRRMAIHAGARPVRKAEVVDLLARLASTRFRETGLDPERAVPLLEPLLRQPASLPMSAVVCLVTLGQPIRDQELGEQLGVAFALDSDREQHSNWGWPLQDVEALDPPVPTRGAQGIWTWLRETA